MNIVASLFNLGGPDFLIILLIVLIIFGPKKLPELARGLGQAMNEFTKAKDEMHRQIVSADAPVVKPPQNVQPSTAYAPAPTPPEPVTQDPHQQA